MKKRVLLSMALVIILVQSVLLPAFATDARPSYYEGVQKLKSFIRQEGITKDGVTVYLLNTDSENVEFAATIGPDERVMLAVDALPPSLNGNGYSFSSITVLGISATDSEWEILQQETLTVGKTSVTDSVSGHIDPLTFTSDSVFEVESFKSASNSAAPGDKLVERGTDGLHSIITILDRDLKAKNADITLSDLGLIKYEVDPERESQIIKAPVDPAPLSLSKLELSKNSIGVPVVSAVFMNTGNKAVEGFDFVVKCYDVYGEIVKGYNRYDSISCSYDQIIYPSSTSRWDWQWVLNGFDGAKTIKIAICKYKLQGESPVEIPDGQLIWIEK